jgi:hypothetical protein
MLGALVSGCVSTSSMSLQVGHRVEEERVGVLSDFPGLLCRPVTESRGRERCGAIFLGSLK